MTETVFTEEDYAELRRIRDAIYERPLSEDGWLACRDAWMRDRDWLLDHEPMPPTPPISPISHPEKTDIMSVIPTVGGNQNGQ